MISSIIYGLTIGSIFYCFSVGLSLTWGTMQIINFAHGAMFALGVYFLLMFFPLVGGNFVLAAVLSVLLIIPLAYLIEAGIIRRLYGKAIFYAVIATSGVLYIQFDVIRWQFGAVPLHIPTPVRGAVEILGLVNIPIYRLIVIVVGILVFIGVSLFFKYTMSGKIIKAALDDEEGLRSLGINKHTYFSIVFIMGSALAALGGILYGPFTAATPYMGLFFLGLAFAVVIVGGHGNMKGTFIASYALGLLVAITAIFFPRLSYMAVYLVMALTLAIRRTPNWEGVPPVIMYLARKLKLATRSLL